MPARAEIVARAAAARGFADHSPVDRLRLCRHRQRRRISEDEPIAPLNVYGASKAAGDAAVAAANPGASGAAGVVGIRRSTARISSKPCCGSAASAASCASFRDQIGGPTEARDIADAILAMAAACCRPGFSAWGVYHFAGTPSVELARFCRGDLRTSARPAAATDGNRQSATIRQPAARPLNSTLDCRRIRQTFGIEQPDWRLSLSRVVADLEEAAE